ncbi:hypothetical protein [Actinokineospora iranica]|uniref:Uncharacterized protein n=1 Tax=Actinokineospora iranica TaxID=1271860 RepID=A0A1G6SJ38_9PSEU|nr:hypothetical protein [Actinokineospora iranica]SDD16922.1 hypothetical protein SAMN05216174_10815 [Actinokineospora iranica]
MIHDDEQPMVVDWLDMVGLAELIPQPRHSPENWFPPGGVPER